MLKKYHMISLTDSQKAFDKIQQTFRIKILSKLVIEWNFLDLMNIYNRLTAVIVLNGERLDTYSLKIRNKARMSSLIIPIQYHTRSCSLCNKKNNKMYTD